jgi:hypothetical protein
MKDGSKHYSGGTRKYSKSENTHLDGREIVVTEQIYTAWYKDKIGSVILLVL